MKKTLLSFALGAMISFCAVAQDVDYTNLIINNSFEYAWEGQVAQSGIDGWYSSTWRPWKATNSDHQKFYGWNVTDWNFKSTTNYSQSLESLGSPREQSFNIAIFGDKKFGDFWELYQVIDKSLLSAGIYKVQARLAVDKANALTSQRLFANQNVQYHGTAAQYVNNLTDGEVNTFAGYPGTANALVEMTVYTAIGEDDDLKIGIRSGGKFSDGTMAADAGSSGTLKGSFKADYFRVTKVDPANYGDAALSSLSLSAYSGVLTPTFNPDTKLYTCILPKGTTSVTPVIKTRYDGANYTGVNAVDVSSGTGSSIIVVTALDGVNSKTYTINYSIATNETTNLSNLITNNSFESAWEGQLALSGIDGWYSNTWRPWKATLTEHQKFYGWDVTDWTFRSATNYSQSLESSANPRDLNFDITVFGNQTFGELWELYQVIDKGQLSAGTYKVQARLAAENAKRTSQRLFANQNVQYHGLASQYVNNLTTNEVNTFAGYPGISNVLDELTVYTTIGEEESLKIGIRTGGKLADGTMAAAADPLWGSFKADFFRLVKIDPQDATNANLASITLSAGSLNFAAEKTSYNVELPAETTSVMAIATAALEDVKVTGTGVVDVSSGTGVSTITVNALDGTTIKTYTINYVVGGSTNTNVKTVKANCTYKIVNRKLSVYGSDAYTVYSVNGVKVAEINNNVDGTNVALCQGVYFLKTAENHTLKVIVR